MVKPSKPSAPVGRAGGGDYAVGYGKPPATSQFKKGQSGNPCGGSRKVRAHKAEREGSPFDQIILDEITRPIAITENGMRTQGSALQAITRSVTVDAAKGNRSAQKLLLDRAQAAHERQQKATAERFGLLVQYKTEQTLACNGGASPASLDAPVWPHPDDVVLDYINCIGEVVGPIDAQQAQPFATLADDYRIWRARLGQIQNMAVETSGDWGMLYTYGINAITGLLETIRNFMPPSFKRQLDRDEGEPPAGALNIEGLDGLTTPLALLPPQSDGMAYALYQLISGAQLASPQIRGRAKLNIAANTASLVNRLRIERQNRDAGVAPAAAIPDFAQFYDCFGTENHDTANEGAA